MNAHRPLRHSKRFRPVLVVVLVATALLGAGGVVTADASAVGSAAVQASCTAPAWNSGAAYNQGDVVSHNGHQWSANHWMWPGVEPGVSGSPPWWVPWADLGPCGPGSTTTSAPGSTTTTSTPGSTTTTTPPSEGVEERFDVAGPWAVTTGTAPAPGTPGVTLYYPTNLGADGYKHPIISFGNGTGNTCPIYEQWLRHLASWGFAVVCPNSSWTGSGEEIWAAARWLRDQNSATGSVFSGKLDPTSIGVTGGSQGASGAVNAEILSNGEVDSTVGVALVDPVFHIWGPPPDFTQVQAPTFLLSGTADWLINQAQQTTYYNAIPGPAGKAARVGSDHNNIGGPTYGLGYTTAWFKYTLEGDQFARRAFVGDPPEIMAESADVWTNQALKGLS
jgi:hypothetical protein